MGNFQERLANAKPIEQFQDTIQNIIDERSDSEIEITNKLVQVLSAVNTKRIYSKIDVKASSLNWDNYVFICMHGIPSVPGQFDFLELPGQTIFFSAAAFEEGVEKLQENEQLKRYQQSRMEIQAEKLRNLINKIDPSKKLIFVYHSFGNFILSFYLYYFGNQISQRIKGMIDIAGAPMKFYMVAKMGTPLILETSEQQMVKESAKIHKIFSKVIKSTGFPLDFKSKYQTISFMNFFKSKDFGKAFKNTGDHPSLLKLIVHGSKDAIFESKLLNDKAIYHCYKKTIQNNSQLLQKYTKLYNPKQKPKNLQERFIINIPKGVHSLHLQKHNQELIKLAAQQYLYLIHE